jgi:hypothetical protein
VAEIYDPGTGAFGRTGATATQGYGHTATLLADGRVLVAGGDATYDQDQVASAELYDPKTGTFRSTHKMKAARTGHTATLLADGRVLIAGGWPENEDGDVTPLASAEIYDPTTGTFSLTGPMTTPRIGHTATMLADGRILIAGGSSAEIYDPDTGKFSSTGP